MRRCGEFIDLAHVRAPSHTLTLCLTSRRRSADRQLRDERGAAEPIVTAAAALKNKKEHANYLGRATLTRSLTHLLSAGLDHTHC